MTVFTTEKIAKLLAIHGDMWDGIMFEQAEVNLRFVTWMKAAADPRWGYAAALKRVEALEAHLAALDEALPPHVAEFAARTLLYTSQEADQGSQPIMRYAALRREFDAV